MHLAFDELQHFPLAPLEVLVLELQVVLLNLQSSLVYVGHLAEAICGPQMCNCSSYIYI